VKSIMFRVIIRRTFSKERNRSYLQRLHHWKVSKNIYLLPRRFYSHRECTIGNKNIVINKEELATLPVWFVSLKSITKGKALEKALSEARNGLQ
jgi:1,4-dihydroxy-2-naphthoyl-CoA synthase